MYLGTSTSIKWKNDKFLLTRNNQTPEEKKRQAVSG
jgi:hypothetical protein